MYDAVLHSQIAALSLIRAGVPARSIDAEARRVLGTYGLQKAFKHSLGHGVGLQIHEPLRLGPMSTEVLRDGHVVTVEPGVYIGGVGGVRIEDDVVVRPHGVDMLTSLPKELIIL
jgi:Xaa-Pro aminopeptidase